METVFVRGFGERAESIMVFLKFFTKLKKRV